MNPLEHLSQRLRELGYHERVIGGMEVLVPPVCDVPTGPFTMGSDNKQRSSIAQDNESPQHTVTLSAYHISTYPLTVAEYACAVRVGAATKPATDRRVTWQRQLTHLDHPVVNITWFQAEAYAAWLAQVTGERWRLPTEAEWEKAVRGTDGRPYPWGDWFYQDRANTYESKIRTTTAVGSYPQGASPYGVQDMAGNVWEWTSTIYSPYPYRMDDGRENTEESANARVLRGGSWYVNYWCSRTTCRISYQPVAAARNFGARLVCEAGG